MMPSHEGSLWSLSSARNLQPNVGLYSLLASGSHAYKQLQRDTLVHIVGSANIMHHHAGRPDNVSGTRAAGGVL